MPLVRPWISWSVMPCHVVRAVSPWSWLTAFAPFVRRSENAVMSNCVQVVVHADALGEHVLDRQAAGRQHRSGDAPDEVGIEAFVAGRDRGVDGEDAVTPDLGPGVGLRLAGRQVLAGALGQQERGVALVEVPHGRRQAEGADRADAADPEDQLLVQPHLAAADVQDVGDRPVGERVLGHVRVEQQDRDPPDLGEPDGDREIPAGQLDRDGQRQPVGVLDAADRQPAEVVVGVVVLLVAVGIDGLAEVAVAIQQADAERRQGHVAGGLHVVAGEDAQAARVDAERLVQAVLRAEVGDRAGQVVGVALLEPVVGAVRHVVVEGGEDVVVLGQERRIVKQPGPLGRTADDRHGIAVAVPGVAVDEAPQAAGPGVPRPVQVVRHAAQPFESGRQGEGGGRDRGDVNWVHGRG